MAWTITGVLSTSGAGSGQIPRVPVACPRDNVDRTDANQSTWNVLFRLEVGLASLGTKVAYGAFGWLDKPVVVHNPGFKQNIALWEDIQNVFMRSPKLKIKCPSELSIITWNSRPNKGLFEKSLDRFDIPHTVLGKTSRWFGNKRKLVLSIKFLQECQTPYVMGVDCFDAISCKR